MKNMGGTRLLHRTVGHYLEEDLKTDSDSG